MQIEHSALLTQRITICQEEIEAENWIIINSLTFEEWLLWSSNMHRRKEVMMLLKREQIAVGFGTHVLWGIMTLQKTTSKLKIVHFWVVYERIKEDFGNCSFSHFLPFFPARYKMNKCLPSTKTFFNCALFYFVTQSLVRCAFLKWIHCTNVSPLWALRGETLPTVAHYH